MRIIQRHLLGDLLLNGIFTFLVLSGMIIMLVFSVVALRSSTASLSVGALLEMVAFLAANRLDIILPLTVLVSTIWTYGRAKAEGEITAMRGAGIHLYHILLPAAGFGALVTLSLAWIQDEIIPEAHYQQLVIGKRHLADNIEDLLRDDSKVISDKRFKCIWSGIGDEDGFLYLENIVVSEFKGEGAPPRITRAARAEPRLNHSTMELKLTLRGLVRGDDLSSEEMTVTINLRTLSSKPPPSRRTNDLTYEELMTRFERFPGQSLGFKAHAEYHKRFAVSFSALLFALLGAPLGLVLRISNRAVVFTIGFLLVVFFHYGPMAVGINLAKDGSVPPILSVWFGNAMILCLSVITLKKANAH